MQSNLTIGILSWKDHKTLRNTLESYKRANLASYASQMFIFFNEISEKDKRIAEEYGIEYFGSETNLGIAGGYKAMLGFVETPYYLFLENDWMIREDRFPIVEAQLRQGELFLKDGMADVVRFRNRRDPGEPLWTRQFQGKELERPEHLFDCLNWIDKPDEKFPSYISGVNPNWYVTTSPYANWTNNPHMVRMDWVHEVLETRLDNDEIERGLNEWWPTTSFRVVQGDGLFTHNRVFNIRGVEMMLFDKDKLSEAIRRDKDFFEADILDYIREKYPVQQTIVDAGASLGNHTLYFANFLKYKAIHCFEPIPEIFRLLKINAVYPNVYLYNQALSHKEEILRMYFNRVNTGASKVKTGGEVEVKAVTIDSLNLQDVTLIKIDVEDSEEYVIKGAKETIERCHPLILVEDYRNRPWDEILPGYELEKGWPSQHTFLFKWNGKKKPYLIQLYTRTPGCANYERTFPVVADSVRPLPIVLRTYRGHLHRWDHMPMTLGDNMCIFTDSADVIFQKPFPELDPTKIYVSNEGVTFGQNGVWRGLIRRYPQFQFLWDEIIYNVGTFACSGTKMKEWTEYLWSVRGKCRMQSNEQLWYNEWLRLPQNKPLITEHPDLFAVLYANIKVGTAFLKDGKFVNKDGIPFSAVHFNGGTKDDYKSVLYNL